MSRYQTEIDTLLQSTEPILRLKTRIKVLGEDGSSPEVQALMREVPSSPRLTRLLSERDSGGRIPWHPYKKWRGAHWVLACLADLAYPPGDKSLLPLVDQVYDWLLSPEHIASIKAINGRVRCHASLEGNALYASLALGLADDRAQQLVERLVRFQWPDGGWNCHRKPEAIHSSYHESLIPLRGLSQYAKQSGDPQAALAAERAAEIFLKRHLFKRQSTGRVIKPEFVRLHYPPYWHYDFLFGLKVLAEAGWLGDPRCTAALDLLESRRLPGGGFPAEGTYYRVSEKLRTGNSLVSWGGTGQNILNEFVTVDALYVLRTAGRV